MRLFSDVRSGESPTALLMMLNIFVVLVAYYVIKTAREPLILATGGAELKSYAAAAQAGVLMLLVPFYSWVQSRVDRQKLLNGVILFFVVCLGLFYVGAEQRVPMLGFAFFVWVGIFSLAIIAQFWAYANDIYTRQEGERLFPIIGIGMTGGSAIGALVAKELFGSGSGASMAMAVTAALLLLHLLLYWIIRARPEARRSAPAKTGQEQASVNGFALIARSPYLRLFALLVLVLNLVNTTGEYILSKAVINAAGDAFAAALAQTPDLSRDEFMEAFIGEFYGEFYFYVNVLTVSIQAFVVSRIVKYLGTAGVLFALPIIALGAYGLVAAGVAFSVLRWAKSAENSTDYSVMNTARALLWLPTDRAEKYNAKQAIDTFVVRIGDLVSAGVVFAGTEWIRWNELVGQPDTFDDDGELVLSVEAVALQVQSFGAFNVALVVVWLGLGWLLYREWKRLAIAAGVDAADVLEKKK